MGVWFRRQLARIPRAIPTTFLDDCSCAFRTVLYLEISNRETEKFDALTMQRVNASKMLAWATNQRMQNELAGLRLAGNRLPVGDGHSL
eukprot:12595452-Alexandrium_andersonii.AAC.1